MITVGPEDDIGDAARKMTENHIRRVPVVDKEELVGLVTASDLINKALWKMDISDPAENICSAAYLPHGKELP